MRDMRSVKEKGSDLALAVTTIRLNSKVESLKYVSYEVIIGDSAPMKESSSVVDHICCM
jgi:hypothetical protein